MIITRTVASVLAALVMSSAPGFSQGDIAAQLAELAQLKAKVGNSDTRVRVTAFHKVWTIGLASPDSGVKTTALDLLLEPAGSMSDHIRMPAVYAIAEIANSTGDVQIKMKALTALREPLQASQLPIRNATIDAVNSITRSTASADLGLAAVRELGSAVKSGNNGVRIPAINAVVRAVESGRGDAACNAALDLLVAPLDSGALIGGFEVRMMAVSAAEKVGLMATEVRTKAKAMGLLQSYAAKGGWEPEAKKRAEEASAAIQNSIDRR